MNYEQLLEQLVQQDERYIILTAENRAAIRNLPQRIGQRFVDVGIAEQTMIGMAAGLALRGRIPIVHALAAFLTMRAFEFIRTDVGIANLPVKLVGYVPGFLSEANGPTHQAIEDYSLMRAIPGMGIFCPADEEDMLIGLPHILASPQPFYIRYTNTKAITPHSKDFSIGQAEVLGEDGEITIISSGILLREAFAAKEILHRYNVAVKIINLRTLQPLDTNSILDAVRNTELVVTLEDHFLTGGVYTTLCELLTKSKYVANVLPFALDSRWFKPALLNKVIEHEGFSGLAIAEKILDTLGYTITEQQWLTLSE